MPPSSSTPVRCTRYVDGDDEHHGSCAAFLAGHPGLLVVPQLVVAEVTYLIAGWTGSVERHRDVPLGSWARMPSSMPA